MESSHKISYFIDHVRKSLAAKLIFSIAALILIGGGFSWYLLISVNRENLIREAINDASAYSELLRKGTRYSMLTFHRDAIQQTVEEVSSRKEVENIRIFNGRGSISYSSKPEEIGQASDKKGTACAGCHTNPAGPADTLKSDGQWSIRDNGGHRVLTFIEPIYNTPSCYIAECHVHSQAQKVLGILQTNFSLEGVDDTIRRLTLTISFFAAAFMTVSAIVLYIILSRFVLKPVSLIAEAMHKVSGGDLKQAVSLGSRDEMGQLASAFNDMTKDLGVARDGCTLRAPGGAVDTAATAKPTELLVARAVGAALTVTAAEGLPYADWIRALDRARAAGVTALDVSLDG